MKVFNELRSRGVHDILIAVVDGLKGLGDAIETAFPKTTVQTCIVHLIRSSLDYASWKERKKIAAALRPIYAAATAEAAREALECQRRLNFDPPQLKNAEVNLTHPGTYY